MFGLWPAGGSNSVANSATVRAVAVERKHLPGEP